MWVDDGVVLEGSSPLTLVITHNKEEPSLDTTIKFGPFQRSCHNLVNIWAAWVI